MKEITATQEDREAAAEYLFLLPSCNTLERLAIKEGKKDNHPLVQAFAKHRIEAEAKQQTKDIYSWKPMTDTRWIDGRDVVLLAQGMEISARYIPGEWSEETPLSPREYDGAIWCCFDDALQFEIEENSTNPEHWVHHPVTHWRDQIKHIS